MGVPKNICIQQAQEEDITVAIGMRKIDVALLNAVNDALSAINQESRDTLMSAALTRSGSAL